MAFTFEIYNYIPVVEVNSTLSQVTVSSTTTAVTVQQNGFINVPVPGPTGPQGPTGSTGPTGPKGDTGTFSANPSFDTVTFTQSEVPQGRTKIRSFGNITGSTPVALDNIYSDKANEAQTIKYMVLANTTSDVHSIEILVAKLPGETDLMFTTYAEMSSANIGEFSFTGGTLIYTPNNVGIMTIKLVKTNIF